MKKLIILVEEILFKLKKNIIGALIIVLFTLGCKKEPETIYVLDERGYKCVNNTCILVESGAEYLSLVDCKSECADNRLGTVEIEVTCPIYGYQQQVNIGIALNSTDAAYNYFIASKQWTGIHGASERIVLNFSQDSLSPGKYYCKVVRNAPQVYSDTRVDIFDIKPNQTTTVSVVY